jgi:uncharacterized RDD family membrane protein YckC
MPSYSSITGVTSGLASVFIVQFLMWVVLGLIYIAYDLFMTKMGGQTVGKMVMGIKVVPVGTTLAPGGLETGTALKRSGVTLGALALYGIPVIGLIAAIGYAVNGASQLWDKPLQQTFADKFARTVVVKIK